ncbi:MAG: AAA family ATPase [Myxococcales bacterium]|nr:AAA family ATPase [Myxococcales bacterium]
MRCGHCHADNRDARRHCADCGAALMRHCPVCAFLNRVDERFCGGCGADRRAEAERDLGLLSDRTSAPPVSPPAPPNRAPSTPRAHPEPPRAAAPRATDSRPVVAPQQAERRQLTVMFCDLADSTAMSQSLDPEDLGELNRAYQDAATAAIERFGGYVARYMGDGVLAYFGYPHAHEDDPERAVRAALSLIDAVQALSLEQGADKGVELHVRAGIATGRVVVGELVGEAAAQERTVVGETPNLAARLQSLAAPDNVVVSGATCALLGDRFVLEDLGARTLKGFNQPQRAYRVDHARARAETTTAPAPGRDGSTPLSGRDVELMLLLDRWERARSGDGQVMLLCGEAGFGKTRLSTELCRRVSPEAAAVVRFETSAFHEGSALYPVLQSLLRRAGIHEHADAETRRLELEHFLAASAEDPRAAVAVLAPLLSLATPDDYPEVKLEAAARMERAFEILQAELVQRAHSGPLLLIGDGLHAADPTTLSFIDRLVELAPQHAMLALLTYRPPLERGWSSRRNVGVLDLGRLRRADVEAIAHAIAGDPPIAEAVLALVAERTDGVPLFVEELTRALVASGDLVERAGRRELFDRRRLAAIPATVQDSLMARLDRMGEAKALAQVAAVVGRQVSSAVLAHMLDRPASELEAAIEPLVEGQVLTCSRSGGSALYTFRQALLRDAAYESLLLSRRKQLHGRAAAALTSLDPELQAREPELFGHHHSLAGQHAEALDCFGQAATLAQQRSAHAEAMAHARAALEALSQLPVVERDSDALLGRRLSLSLALAASARLCERFDDALAALDSAGRLAREHGRLAELTQVHALRGGIYFLQGRADESLQEQRKALDVAVETGGAERVAQAHGGLGDAFYQSGDIQSAIVHFERCIEISRQHGFDGITAAHLPMLGVMHVFMMEVRRGERLSREGVEIAARCKHLRAMMVAGGVLAETLYEIGDIEEAEKHRQQYMEIAQQLGAATFMAFGQLYRGRYLAFAGQYDEAREYADRAETYGRGGAFFQSLMPFVCGIRVASAESLEQFESELAGAREVIASSGGNFGLFWYFPLLIEGALLTAQWSEVEQLIEQLLIRPFATGARGLTYCVERARALMQWARGGPSDARRALLVELLERAQSAPLRTQVPLLEAALDGRWPASAARYSNPAAAAVDPDTVAADA